MPHKIELRAVHAGDPFYFPNDPDLHIWIKTGEKRRNKGAREFITTGTQTFCYCHRYDDSNIVEDYEENRMVMAFYGGEKIIAKPPEYKKETPVYIAADIQLKKNEPTQSNYLNMNHSISTKVKVYETTEYRRFDKLKGNRKVNETKIKKIIKEITAGNDMLQHYPIQVQEHGDKINILDGQHRFEICKRLKRPVYYLLIEEKKSMPEIAKVNSNVEKWKHTDYINCYISEGNKNYSQLNTFLLTYNFSVGICLNLLTSGTPGKVTGEQKDLQYLFEHGQFTIQKYDEAVKIAELCKRFDYFTNWRSRDFVIAVYRIFTAEKFPFDDVIKSVEANKNMLTQQANYKEYLFKIEQIVNIGKKNRIVLT